MANAGTLIALGLTMRTLPPTLTLRIFLLSALGAFGCGSHTVLDGDPARGGGSGSGGSTGGAGTGGATTGGGSSTGAAGPTYSSACTNPTPILEGEDTGIFHCQEGYLHRAEARTCPTELPRDITLEWPSSPDGNLGGAGGSGEVPYTTSTDDCSRDEDCGDPLAYCVLRQTNAPFYDQCAFEPPVEETPNYARYCVRGCRVDADCGSGFLCICGEPVGHCASISAIAGCHSDADCEGDAQCLDTAHTSYHDENTFACQLPGDSCDSDADCDGYQSYCVISATGRACKEIPWSCGRPFLIKTTARRAAPSSAAGWLTPSSNTSARATPLSPEVTRVLAAHWTEIGLMEHASIAAFARFTLQLLSMGAPAELVEASNRAQTDETRHARMAFDLASRYAGDPVGPGPLSLAGTVLDAEWESILLTTIEEGCLGETCAALEASHAAELCVDPAVSDVLRAIAKDEAEHAALAWRAVRWMLQARPSLRTLAERTFGELADRIEGTSAALTLSERTTAEHYGALEDVTRAACRANAVREIVLPCARTLLASNADEAPRAARTVSTAVSL